MRRIMGSSFEREERTLVGRLFVLLAAAALMLLAVMPAASAEVSEKFHREGRSAWLEFNNSDYSFWGEVSVHNFTENDGSGPVDASYLAYYMGTPSGFCDEQGQGAVTDFEFSWSQAEAHVSFLAGACGLVEIHWEADRGAMDRNYHQNQKYYSAGHGGDVHILSFYQYKWATTSVTIGGVDAGTSRHGFATINKSTYSFTVKPAEAP